MSQKFLSNIEAGAASFSGNITVGDSHFIGDDSFDNLLLQSSSGENLNLSSANDIIFFTGGTAPDALGTQRLRIFNSDGSANFAGNLGIGIDTPTLVAGKIVHIHGVAAGVHLTDTASGTANTDGAYMAFDNPHLFIQNKEAGDIRFETSATTRLTIDSSGNSTFTGDVQIDGSLTGAGAFVPVGGGTFTGIVTTDKILVVKGQNVSHGTSQLKISQEDTTKSQLRFYGADTSTAGILEFIGSSSNGSVGGTRLTLNADGSSTFAGNVKIGTSTTGTPSTNADDLVIDKGASESGITLISTAAASIRFGDAANTSIGFIEYNHNSNYMRFGTDASERIRITSDGNTTFIKGADSNRNANSIKHASNDFLYIRGGAAGAVLADDGEDTRMILFNNGNVRFDAGTKDNAMIIEGSTGDVGIGVTDPAARLHISGTGDAIRVESTNTGVGGAQMDLFHYTTSPADEDVHGFINFGGYFSGTSASTGSQILSKWTDVSERHARLEFKTADTSVGLALTLAHDKSATFPGNLFARRGSFGTAANFNFDLYNNGTSYFNGAVTIDDNATVAGNVIIGDTSGTSPNSADRFLKIGKSNLQDCSIILQDAVETWEIYQNDDLQFSFGTTPSTVMTMQRTTGNVGISATNPATPLDVRRNDTGTAAILTLRQEGTGDASIDFQTTTSPFGFNIGVDGSDSDKFKIASGLGDIGTNTRLTIDTSGNVGIGTASPVGFTNQRSLTINGTSIGRVDCLASGGGGGGMFASSTQLQVFSNSGVALQLSSPTSIDFITGSTARMEINSSGETDFFNNVEIKVADTETNASAGTNCRLFLNNTSNTDGCLGVIDFRNNSTFVTARIGAQFQDADDKNTDLFFMTRANGGNLTEKMRITSGGKVGIGETSPTYKLHVKSSNNVSIFEDTSNASGAAFLVFNRPSVFSMGSITRNGSANSVSFNTGSDYRLKEDLKDFNALNLINNIKAYDYKWKDVDQRDYGFVAHELKEILPNVVTGEKDGEIMQGVDYSKLTPVLLKAIQELKAEIETLKTQINN